MIGTFCYSFSTVRPLHSSVTPFEVLHAALNEMIFENSNKYARSDQRL